MSIVTYQYTRTLDGRRDVITSAAGHLDKIIPDMYQKLYIAYPDAAAEVFELILSCDFTTSLSIRDVDDALRAVADAHASAVAQETGRDITASDLYGPMSDVSDFDIEAVLEHLSDETGERFAYDDLYSADGPYVCTD